MFIPYNIMKTSVCIDDKKCFIMDNIYLVKMSFFLSIRIPIILQKKVF